MFEVSGQLTTGTYGIMQASLSSFDSQCIPERANQPASGSVEIMEAAADRVTGSIELTDTANARSFSGAFDLPFCPLPEQPAGRYCVQQCGSARRRGTSERGTTSAHRPSES